MSLISFIKLSDVKSRMKPFRPKLPRKLRVPLKLTPRSKRLMLVGVAFDYLLRFELQRRAPHAVPSRWIADQVPEKIFRATETGSIGVDVLRGADPDVYMPPEEVAKRARRWWTAPTRLLLPI